MESELINIAAVWVLVGLLGIAGFARIMVEVTRPVNRKTHRMIQRLWMGGALVRMP